MTNSEVKKPATCVFSERQDHDIVFGGLMYDDGRFLDIGGSLRMLSNV